MNILIFVLTVLLVISSISYQALERYRVGAVLRKSWDHYMRIDATCQFNKVVEEQYRTLRKKGGKSNPTQDTEAPAEEEGSQEDKPKEPPGSSVINFRFLINPEYGEMFPEQTPLMLTVLKNLINLLYSKHPFYQQLLQERPNVLEELFNEIQHAQAQRPKKQRINKVNRINQIQPQDEKLQMLWNQLLRENPLDKSVMNLLWQNVEEPCIQVSLLNYLSNSPAPKVRVFLAPRALLYAIFQNQDAVMQIINKRMELYRALENKEKNAAEATEELKSFSDQFIGNDLQPILNYQVTKTNPSYYEE